MAKSTSKEVNPKTEPFIEPILIKAGSDLIKLGKGLCRTNPTVDCRVISEDQYQLLKSAYDKLNEKNKLHR